MNSITNCRVIPRWTVLILIAFHASICFAATNDPPNVVLILADDLGFSDLGCYGGEIKTPSLDRLAANGLRFSQFYNTARCWPTRACLMTGYYAQQVRRDAIPGYKDGPRQRPEWAKILPLLLKPRGYRSYHSGKWHLDGQPVAAGFDLSYRLADHGRFFSPQRHLNNDKRLAPIERSSGYYSTTAIAEHAIECLQNHEQENSSKPFFSFIAFTAPHFPLHALPEDIERYQGIYDRGWEEIRRERWRRIQDLGYLSTSLSAVERNLGPPYHFPKDLDRLGDGEVFKPLPWDELTEEQQKFQATKMEIHAAMVDRMDREIGRVIEQLEKMNVLENTLIMFLSDNGASAEIMVRDDGHDPNVAPGSAGSHLCLGPGWSTVSNTPFRRHKTWVHEGGISTPFIVHWPGQLKDAGTWRNQPAHVIDAAATILDCAGVKIDQSDQEKPDFPGRSFKPILNDPDFDSAEKEIWWAHDGHRAIRVGDLKLVAAKNEPWELYDLSNDRAESKDLAPMKPDEVQKLAALWNRRAKQIAEDSGRKKK